MNNKLTESNSEQARLKNIIKIGFGSQSEFARALSMNPQEFTNYFGGRRGFGEALREKLESVGVSYEYFKSGTGSPYNLTEAGQQLAQKFGATPVISATAKDMPDQQPHKWALIREWLTETGTMTEWYFRIQERIPEMTLDYLLSLEGLVQAQERQDLETLLWSFLIQNGVNVDWLLPNAISASPFIDSPNGEALVARLKARYAKRDTARESATPSQYLEEELYSQDH